MNLTLFKTSFKKNLILLIIFTLVSLMYSTVMIAMYSPDSLAALNAMFTVLPPDMMKVLGFSNVFTTLVGYLASWLYGLILTAFPMVYCIIVGNRLVAKTVDSGSMACLLATPNSRAKIIATKGIYAQVSVFIIMAIVCLVNLALASIMFPSEQIEFAAYIKLNLTVTLVNMTVMAIVFFCSCVFSNATLAMGFGSGIPIAFLMLNMLGNAADDIAFLKRLSIYGWYNPVGIANGDSIACVTLVYTGIILALFFLSIAVFNKRRLSI